MNLQKHLYITLAMVVMTLSTHALSQEEINESSLWEKNRVEQAVGRDMTKNYRRYLRYNLGSNSFSEYMYQRYARSYRKGKVMTLLGGVLLGSGVAMMLGGSVLSEASVNDDYAGELLILGGVGSIVPGIVFLAIGIGKRFRNGRALERLRPLKRSIFSFKGLNLGMGTKRTGLNAQFTF